jgi:hypothetical protein
MQKRAFTYTSTRTNTNAGKRKHTHARVRHTQNRKQRNYQFGTVDMFGDQHASVHLRVKNVQTIEKTL